LTTADIKKNTSGEVLFDDAMTIAVKAYESDRGITEDGQISKTTAIALKNDAESYRRLGSRILALGMSGTDVSELKNLLIDKEIIKGKKKGLYEVTTLDETIFEMLEVFLSDNGFDWTGKVDNKVIDYLKNL
jgi:hypothetical protein